MALVGKPVFRNSASTVAANLFEGACQKPPPLTGSYDHLEIIDARFAFNELQLTSKRTFPAGSVPLINELGRCGLMPVAARTVMETIGTRRPTRSSSGRTRRPWCWTIAAESGSTRTR